jgi:exodeoxyribonuclease-1
LNQGQQSILGYQETTRLSTNQTLYFYDLETSGFNARNDRIMQFAGQRVDMDLNPVGEPDNILITLTEDVLPGPDAILVTGITPQKTLAEGVSEAEFARQFQESIATPGTIFVGFNTIRFDDEFMRFLLYRNYYDAYTWQWKDGRGRWDLLDVVRMTRALRPDGIKWPVDTDGKPTNRLELLAAINKLAHDQAHDALSDVRATIDLAKLLKSKQPKLFDYLLDIRDKKAVAAVAQSGQPFIYTSGKYPSEYEKTTVVCSLADHPKTAASLVYDLRVDPTPFLQLSPEELVEAWKYKKDSDEPRLPVKTLRYNRCPAIAPLGVLDTASRQRLGIDLQTIEANRKTVLADKDFVTKLFKALDIMDKQQQTRLMSDPGDVDSQLYDGFVSDSDRAIMERVQQAAPTELSIGNFTFSDERLKSLFVLYKARNFPKALSDEERTAWESFRTARLQKQLPTYMQRLSELAVTKISDHKQYLLEELRLYAESIMPELE